MYATFHSSYKCKGISLFLSLFILVVLGLLAAALFRMNTIGETSVARETLSIRAFFAAESGLQSNAMQLFPLAGVGACNNQVINFAANGLTGCNATVTCSGFLSDGEQHYIVSSTGQCGTGDSTASRTLEAMFKAL